MAVIEALTEEECYLLAILQDESGLDQAEFTWTDHERDDMVWRAWPFQWSWFRSTDPLQIDQCFAAGTLILTSRGQMPIEDVVVDDEVLTHAGRWKRVTFTWERGEQPLVVLKGHGHPGLRVTSDHKFLTADGQWEAPDEGSLWGSPSEFPSADVPALQRRTYAPGRPSNVPNDVASPDFLWLYGLYLAEGSCSSSFGRNGTLNRTTFSVHTDEVAKVEASLTRVGIRFNTQQVADEACFNIVVNSRPLASWFRSHGGKGAHDKEIASWVLGLSTDQRQAVLDGAMFGDGYTARNEYTTVSRKLALGVKLLGQSLGMSATFRMAAGRTSHIGDRALRGSDQYIIGLSRTGKAARIGRDSHWWSRIKSKIAAPAVRCYDLEVEDDHSFIAEGIVVSNCARAVGKSLSIKLRGCAFPMIHPGQEMVITAPEKVHLDAITDNIETQLVSTRLTRELLTGGRASIKHQPFHVNFVNGSRIMGRIPQRDGKGVKGMHPIWLEMDEAQDYPKPGWTELIETLKRGHAGAVWRAHGVTRGVRDEFYKHTQPESGWTVHRYCLPGETLVYGIDGPVPISDIEPGTEVWTITENGELASDHVSVRIDNGVQPTWKVKAKGGYGLTSTMNHPYLILNRTGTKKTRRELGFQWVEAQDIRCGDVIVCARELPNTGASVPTPEQVETTLRDHSPDRIVPSWVWTATPSMQLAFLHGYLMGDGSLSRQVRGQDAWQVGTASERMAKELRALCHYLGLRTTNLDCAPTGALGNGPQYRFNVYVDQCWFRQVPRSYSVHELPLGKNFVARTVTLSEATGESVRTYDITVGESHNFIAEGVVVHNTAMHRPTWTDQERQEKIEQYGSKDHPDYRRNVLGLHGDATNPLFVLHRLMKCVDQDETSDYNQVDYYPVRINDEMLREYGLDIVGVLDFPASHKNPPFLYHWVGMDVGYTSDPSEILVFGEYRDKEGPKLKLLTRIHLERVNHQEQVRAILWTIDYYKPKVFAMDKTGLGLPLFQDIQNRAGAAAETIKGYNFSSKILVDFDSTIAVDEFTGDLVKEAGIERNVKEYAQDCLRDLVDTERIVLPWDRELIGQFQGGTYSTKAGYDQYGRRKILSTGDDHALDASRMAALGYKQWAIDEFLKQEDEPVHDIFIWEGDDPGSD